MDIKKYKKFYETKFHGKLSFSPGRQKDIEEESFYKELKKFIKDFNLGIEPILPEKMQHLMGLYIKDNSDLFIDDLTPQDLRTIATHREWYLLNKKT